jgi:hypothetical protein
MIVRAEARTYLRSKGKSKGKRERNGNGNDTSNGNDNGNDNGKGKGKGKGNGKSKSKSNDNGKGNGNGNGSEGGCEIEAGGVGFCRVDVGIVLVTLSDGITQDVLELVLEIFVVHDAVGVVAVLPDCAGGVVAYGEREAALDELCAAFDGDVRRRREDCVDVVGHDDEAVKEETMGVTIAE